MDVADATRRAYAGQFGFGQRSLLDLLDTKNESFNAQLALATRDYAKLGARYRVLAAAGRLLDTLRVAPSAQADAGFVPGARGTGPFKRSACLADETAAILVATPGRDARADP